jgi:hypothetical protein
MIFQDLRFDEVVDYYLGVWLYEIAEEEMPNCIAERRAFLDCREDQLALDLGGCLDSEL